MTCASAKGGTPGTGGSGAGDEGGEYAGRGGAAGKGSSVGGAAGSAAGVGGAAQAGKGSGGDAGEAGASGASDGGTGGGEGGSPGACASPETQCGGACVDLSEDALNCGSCGHDCLKGACADGKCRPAVLATLEAEYGAALGLSPNFVLVAGRFADGMSRAGPIYRVDKASGGVELTRPHRSDSSYAYRLWGSASTLVTIDLFSSANGVRYFSHCSLADCTDSVPAAGSFTFNNIWDFAADDATARAFWFDPTSGELMATSAESWAPSSVAAATAVAVKPSEDPNGVSRYPQAMTFGDGKVYAALQYTVDAVAVTGATAPDSVSGYPTGETGAFDLELATTNNSLLLFYRSTGNVYRAPLPAGIDNRPPDKLQGPTGALNIATSGSTLFWSGYSTVYSCTLADCASPQTLATDDAVIEALAVDETAIYWLSRLTLNGGATAEDTTTSVMRLAR